MIRELTKSALSFSWALSLLGVKQAVSLGQQNGNGDLFSPVTQIAVGQLDESMKGIYRSGDNMGSRMVDAAFSWMNPMNWFNPGTWTGMLGGTPMSNWADPSTWLNPATWMRSAANFTSGIAGCGNGGAPQPPGGNPPNASGTPSSGSMADWGTMPGNQS